MPVIKTEKRKKKTKHVAFSVKTACTFYLSCVVCVVLSARPRRLQGCRFVRCSIVDVNSVWGLDLRQTGRQSLSSQQPTSLSATLAATKSIMFGLLCHFHHRGEGEGRGGLPSIFYSFRLSWMVHLQSGQHAKQKREGLPIWKPWVNPVAFWARGDWGGGGGEVGGDERQ